MNHNKGYKISCRLDGLLERTAAEIVNSKRMNERRSHNIHSSSVGSRSLSVASRE